MNAGIRIAMAVAASSLAVGCTSYDKMLEQRRARLLEVYPLQTTTREDVAKKWAPAKPEVSHVKPASGWLALEDATVGKRADAIEKKVRGDVTRVERYFGPYGLFGLCWCWFYYDVAGRLIDAEWQYVSD